MPPHRTVLLLGHGIRTSGAAHLAPNLLQLDIPVLASWQAKDLVDNTHPLFLGCPGIYGNRAANKALAAATHIVAIGNRLAIWNVGYDGLRPDQSLELVTLDDAEAARWTNATVHRIDCKHFLENLHPTFNSNREWATQCILWNTAFPWIEYPAHLDSNGYPNSYRVFEALSNALAEDAIVTIDCGSACASAFQTLCVKPPQRLISSGGLGEMGCAIPAAIGAAFANPGKQVICITGDGALMLNLASLETISHHNLNVKIIVCQNDGYMMIRRTQRNARLYPSGLDAKSGVTTPSMRDVAATFCLVYETLYDWKDVNELPGYLANGHPTLIDYRMDPEQLIAPKLDYHWEDGKPVYDTLDAMSPRL